MVLSAHGIVAATELAVYALLLVPATLNVIYYGMREHTGWLFLVLFSLFKITGAALLIYTAENPTTAPIGAQIAVQIFYQIALGPLLSATLSFFNGPIHNKATTPSSGGIRAILPSLPRFLRLIHLVVILALTLGSAGGSMRAPDKNGQFEKSSYDTGAALLRTSSVLFLVALSGITWGLVRYWGARSAMPEPQKTILPAVAAAAPLLLMRVVYSLLGSFTLDTSGNMNNTLVFSMFLGSTEVYIVLAMLPQIGVVVLYSVMGYIAQKRHQMTESVHESNGSLISMYPRHLEHGDTIQD